MKTYILIPVVILKTKTGYNGFSPVIEGCAATDKTIDRTLRRLREALEFHLEGAQLLKQKKVKTIKALRDTFDEYGTDAVYASLKIAA